MSIYSVPDDVFAGKSWSELWNAGAKGFGLAGVPSARPFAAGAETASDAAAMMAVLPLGVAASMMGAWAGAMDGMLAASRRLAAVAPAMPDAAALDWTLPPAADILSFPVKGAATAAAKPDVPAIPAEAETVLPPAEADAPVEEMAAESAIPAVAPLPEPAAASVLPAVAKAAKAERPAALLDLVAIEPESVAAKAPEAIAPAPAVQADALAPEDFRKPAAIARPALVDDLKMISGVGPKIEKTLHGLGIFTFAQVAAWSPAEIAWVDDYLNFKGRITRDGWIAQADALAAGGRDEYVRRFGKEPR